MGNEQKGKAGPVQKMPSINEVKTYIMIIQNKLTLFRNKKVASIKQKKKEIVKSLKENNLDVAKAKMDTIIREEDTITVYDILGPLCEILKERVTYIMSNTECPPDLRAQLDSVIYASTRMEIEELQTLRDMIMRRYGQSYIMKAESNADKLVNVNLVEKLRIKPASDVFITIRLKQLCKEQKIPFEFPMEVENDIAIDPMNPQNPYGEPGMNPFDNQPNKNPNGPPQNNNNPYGPPSNNNNPYGPPQNNNNPYGPPQNNNNPYGPPPDNNNNPYGPPPDNGNPYGPPSGNNNNNPYGGQNNNNFNNPYDKPPNDNNQMNNNPYGPQQGGNPFDNNQGSNPYGPPPDANPFGNNNQNQGGDQTNKPFEQNSSSQFGGMSQDNNDNNLDCNYTSLRNKPPKKGENTKEENNQNMSQLSQSKEKDNNILQESPSSGNQSNNDNPYASQVNENNKNDNPFGGETNGNPYEGESNKNDNPFGWDNNKNDNPFGGETNGNPYEGDSNKNDNPFGGQSNDNPYGGDSNNNNENPFLQDNSNPFGNSMANSIVNPYAGESNEKENKDDDFPKAE